MIAWKGHSLIGTKAKTQVILTGIETASKNSKTLDMVQGYILVDQVDPVQAQKRGRDESICGQCPLRWFLALAAGTPRCYVVAVHDALSTWKAHRGKRAKMPTEPLGRPLRIGTYGDPAAVPVKIWRNLIKLSGYTIDRARKKGVRWGPAWSGYTHQWRRAPHLKAITMASVDNEAEALAAQAKGWRTYRHRPHGAPLLPSEIDCPHPTRGVTCNHCSATAGLCNGRQGAQDKRPSISIENHGQ